MDADKLLHVDAIDYLLRNPQVAYAGDRGRLAGLNATTVGSFADNLLEQAPAAAAELINNQNPEAARELLKKLDSRHRTEFSRRNYGFDIEGHHPIGIGSSHMLASDMSMKDAQTVYSIGRYNGVEHGTRSDYMLPITRIAHDIAHIDPITHKTNKSGFQLDNSLFRQKDPETRAIAALPLNLLEQSLSKLAFNRPEEQRVRKFAGDLLGITPEQLISFELDPNYRTNTGRPGKISYVNAAKKKLGQAEMASALEAGWGMSPTMSRVILPNQMKVNFKTKPSEYRDRVSPGISVQEAIANYRPGQEDNVRRLIRGR